MRAFIYAHGTKSRSDMYAYQLSSIYLKGFKVIERTSFPLSNLLKGENSRGKLGGGGQGMG